MQKHWRKAKKDVRNWKKLKDEFINYRNFEQDDVLLLWPIPGAEYDLGYLVKLKFNFRTISRDDNTTASSDSSASSDFTFPTPAITPPSFSSFNEIPGSENMESDREGAFDDLF